YSCPCVPLLPLVSCYAAASTEIYTLSLHDALPIWWLCVSRPGKSSSCPGPITICSRRAHRTVAVEAGGRFRSRLNQNQRPVPGLDRKSTRLNSSHVKNSYAVFCLKKKTTGTQRIRL